MKNRRIDWVVAITAVVFAVSCSGGGCGGCGIEPIPGGYPANKREANAAQVRLSSSAITKITADPASIIGPLIGGAMNGVIDFPIPASCGDPKICCVNNVPSATCGPISIDLVKRPTDPARLVLTPVQGASRLDVTLRARVKTKMDLPIEASGFSCTVDLDTTRGSNPDLTITTQVQFSQDSTVGTTRIAGQGSTVSLQNEDIELGGSIICSIAGAVLLGTVRGVLEDEVAGLIDEQLNDATCKSCSTVADCGSQYATACTGGTCQVGSRCLQEVGITGRASGTALFGGLSPGTTGGLDLYEILGGYADTNNGGVALGMLGGMLPGGTDRDRCGPRGTEPADPGTLPISAFFQGNVRPDNNVPFDVAIGLHEWQLDAFAYGGYDGGLLCLTIGNGTVSQLNTDTLALVSRSLGKLVDASSPMAIGLRPQSQPTIILGRNTFTTDAMMNTTLVEPLLDLTFNAMEIDFFASIDDQYVRVFTLVSDVHLPVGLQTTSMGELQPILGDVADAFTNVSVKNAEALTETPAELATKFPALLGLVLPQLSGGLSPIALPAIGGLNLSVVDVTAVDNMSFLAIFANLVTATPARPVETDVTLTGVAEPATSVARDPAQWKHSTPPNVSLDFGSVEGREWSYRIDDGSWSPWAQNRRPTVSSQVFWLPGQHWIDVRSREINKPETLDTTPTRIELVLGTDVPVGAGNFIAKNEFHGQSGSSGCACNSGTGVGGAAPFALVFLMIVLPLGRLRRSAKRLAVHAGRLGVVVWIAALMSLPGCSCGDAPCGDVECLPGEIANGGLGRYTSIASDDDRVIVATYDQGLGDLVAVDVTDPASMKYSVVDGVPDITPTYDPGTYRGGVEDAGDNVGIWTSVAMADHLAKIAYQDRDNTTLKYAYETKPGQWKNYILDPGIDGEDVGSHASLTIDGSGRPAIAYLALGVDDGTGHRVTELRLARASVKNPEDSGDWGALTTIVKGTGTCAGLCGSGTACFAGAAEGDPQSCVATTSDCTSACDSGTACRNGSCEDVFEKPVTVTLATGTGLFVSLLLLPDGRLAAVYYDRNNRALTLALENGVDTSTFTETVLDAVTPGDRGMWASAVVDGSGAIHVAYQDALGDQLMYTQWSGSVATPEIVDDGTRAGDRTHNVGAASAIYLVSGGPVIAYQDGMPSDVYVAAKSGATWTTNGVATTALLDGFSIAATTGHGAPYLAWGALDPAATPLNSLVVQTR